MRFNPRSPRGGATIYLAQMSAYTPVSIHAPHEGERPGVNVLRGRPCGGFQSTLPTRGSDGGAFPAVTGADGFNPRSPRGGATSAHHSQKHDKSVSIHAPHEGERQHLSLLAAPKGGFQSTLPTRGSDLILYTTSYSKSSFNPRSPRGGATTARSRTAKAASWFQSTLPTRGSDAVRYRAGD